MRDLAGGVGAGGHGDGAVGLLEREHVVYAVARHGDGVARGLERADEPALLVRRHAAEHGVFLDGGGDVLVGLERAGVHIALRALNPGALGDLGDGHGVVAGDDLDGHALLGEVFEGVRRLGTDLVREQYERDGQHVGVESLVVRLPVVEREQQHAAALGRVGVYLRGVLAVSLAEEHVRRAEEVGLVLVEADAAEFFGGGEGHGLYSGLLDLAGEVSAQGGHGVVVRAHGGDVVCHDEADVALLKAVRAERHYVLYGHLVLRDGAGLVHAEHVHAREGLDAAHVVHEGLFLREAHHACGEGHAGEEVEPLGYHAYERGDGGDNAVRHAAAQPDYLLYGHEHAERDYGDAYHLHQAGERAHHLRLLGRLGLLGLQRQAVGVGILAHLREARAALPGHDEAAREQLGARGLFYLVRLAGYERLVGAALAGDDHGVGVYLAARGEHDDVVAHHLAGGYLPLPAVADDEAVRGREQRELVERAL